MSPRRKNSFSYAVACFIAGMASILGGSSLFASLRVRPDGLNACAPYWHVSGRILSAVMQKESARLATRDAREAAYARQEGDICD